MIQASDRCFFGTRIGNAGKRGLDETGKDPVNRNDEEEFAVVSIRDATATSLRAKRSNPALPPQRKAGLLPPSLSELRRTASPA
jgi:hypothetical protein